MFRSTSQWLIEWFDLEHVISCIASLIRNCSGSNRQRVISKFTENDHEKVMNESLCSSFTSIYFQVDRLMELHFQYLERVQAANQSTDDEDEDDDEVYLRKLDAGLFTLQLIDYIILEIASNNANISSIRQRVLQILNLRNSSIENIKEIVRGNLLRNFGFLCLLSYLDRIRRKFGCIKENEWRRSLINRWNCKWKQRWSIQTTSSWINWKILTDFICLLSFLFLSICVI